MYPLVLHSLKSMTTMTWSNAPKTVQGARAKAKALEELEAALREDHATGALRVEIRCEGHGDPRRWLVSLRSKLAEEDPCQAAVSRGFAQCLPAHQVAALGAEATSLCGPPHNATRTWPWLATVNLVSSRQHKISM